MAEKPLMEIEFSHHVVITDEQIAALKGLIPEIVGLLHKIYMPVDGIQLCFESTRIVPTCESRVLWARENQHGTCT